MRATATRLLLAGLLAAPPVVGQGLVVPEPTPATRRHLVARRATAKITIDGRLDEADWVKAPVARDFVQSRPDYVPTTRYPSEVRVLFDAEYLYKSTR